MSSLHEILGDLTSESDALDALVAGLADEQRPTPTPAAGWSIATQIAHLAWTDEVAVLAAEDGPAWRRSRDEAVADVTAAVDGAALDGASGAPRRLLNRWRCARRALAVALEALPEGARMPWFGPSMSAISMVTARLMETWAHSVDVHDALGVASPRTDRVQHVCFLGAITRSFAFTSHG